MAVTETDVETYRRMKMWRHPADVLLEERFSRALRGRTLLRQLLRQPKI